MREILFRGKRIDNGEWVDGYYKKGTVIAGDRAAYIADIIVEAPTKPFGDCLRSEVEPDTVGQYTGLNDKNGQRIFEGDIFQYGLSEVAAVAVVKYGSFNFGSQFDMNQVGFYAAWNPRAMYYRTDLGFWVKQRKIEIIGNIHDNPELLEEVKCDG